jgi:hypothetical protein
MAWRILYKALSAGSCRRSKYSSTVLAAGSLGVRFLGAVFFAEGFNFFTRGMVQEDIALSSQHTVHELHVRARRALKTFAFLRDEYQGKAGTG